MSIRTPLKKLPSVEKVLEDECIAARITLLSRGGVTRVVRETITAYRERLLKEDFGEVSKEDLRNSITRDVVAELDRLTGSCQRRVINATGVVLHTNLGRAVLGSEVCSAIGKAASGYIDLEMDLDTGERVQRERRANRLLSLITGAEDALVVNNNAAAVLLAVQTFAGEGAVAVSRGELVEIGGSFRLPEILSKAAGSVLEVGTTNRTHLKDYERAIDDGATLLLKVHKSNYQIIGYTNEVSLKELVELGSSAGVPVMYDQGSGVIYPLQKKGIEGEECMEDVLGSGVDLVSFSADKVLGAPQGGILIGSSVLIERIRRNHLSRALRVDKLTLAGLERVLLHYWLGEFDRIPVLGMITESVESLKGRAERFASSLKRSLGKMAEVSVVDGESSIGGGSYPINPLRTVLVVINLLHGVAGKLSELLRSGDPAILVRVKGDLVYVDLRTVAGHEEPVLLDRLEVGIGNILERE